MTRFIRSAMLFAGVLVVVAGTAACASPAYVQPARDGTIFSGPDRLDSR